MIAKISIAVQQEILRQRSMDDPAASDLIAGLASLGVEEQRDASSLAARLADEALVEGSGSASDTIAAVCSRSLACRIRCYTSSVM
jgi:hypothetical protein